MLPFHVAVRRFRSALPFRVVVPSGDPCCRSTFPFGVAILLAVMAMIRRHCCCRFGDRCGGVSGAIIGSIAVPRCRFALQIDVGILPI